VKSRLPRISTRDEPRKPLFLRFGKRWRGSLKAAFAGHGLSPRTESGGQERKNRVQAVHPVATAPNETLRKTFLILAREEAGHQLGFEAEEESLPFGIRFGASRTNFKIPI